MDRSDRSGRGDRTISRSDRSVDFKNYKTWLLSDDPAVVANAIICLIHQANYLLDGKVQGWRGNSSKKAATLNA